ncbi:MAG: protein kinase, partial [Planctomycetota bacterium]
LEADPDSDLKIPWFSMEYVEHAVTIVDYANARQLGTRERLQLFVPVCAAIQHGHTRGVVHRDIKPSNLLVDGNGRPIVIDFGVACTTDADVALTTVGTDLGQLVGTLQYMSPEQCEADPNALDARTDVYSLGMVLYELLCNCLPYDIGREPVFEAARRIREVAPKRPSTHDRTLRGDLETITLKALEKDRERRYGSVAELLGDIERYLNLMPIRARPPSVYYQLGMFVRRHRAFTAAVLGIALALLMTTVVSWQFALRASRAEKVAVQERTRMARESYIASLAAAESSWLANEYRAMQLHLERAPSEHRGWEWHFLSQAVESAKVQQATSSPFQAVIHTADDLIVTGGDDGTVGVWEARTGKQLAQRKLHDGRVGSLDHQGTVLATGGYDGAVRLWDLRSLEPQGELDHAEGMFRLVKFAPDGDTLYTVLAKTSGRVERWNFRTKERLNSTVIPNVRVWRLDVSQDGARVATAQLDGSVCLFDAETLELERRMQDLALRVHDLKFSRDGKRLFSGHTGHVQIWDPDEGTLLKTLEQQGRALSLAVLDDPRYLIVAWGPAIRILDVETGHEIRTLSTAPRSCYAICTSPSGHQLVAGDSRGQMTVWDLDPVTNLDQLVGHPGQVNSLCFAVDGELILTLSPHPSAAIHYWDARTHQKLATVPTARDGCLTIEVSPDGTRLAQNTSHGCVLRDLLTGEVIRRIELDALIRTACFSENGRWLVLGGLDCIATLWDTEQDQLALRLELPSEVRALAIHDGTLAIGCMDGSIHLYQLDSGEPLAHMDGHRSMISTLVFDPNGEYLFSAGSDSQIRRWEVATQRLLDTLPRHGDAVSSLAVHPDGSRLASVKWYGGIALWDTQDLQPVATLHVKHARSPGRVCFDPQGDRLVVGCTEGGLEIWDRRVPHVRREQRRQALEDLQAMLPRVKTLLAKMGDPRDVATQLRSDPSLNADQRAAALKALVIQVHAEDADE